MRKSIDEFVERIPFSGCWIWVGAIHKTGYGYTYGSDRKKLLAHRAMYEKHIGPIKAGMQIDHLCRVKCCVNPQHLEPVTPRENVMRGISPQKCALLNGTKTHCKFGHEYFGQNLYMRPDGSRDCRACKKVRARRCYEKSLQA